MFMSVYDSLCASCTEFFKFFFPAAEQHNIQILSNGCSIDVIHQATVCILKEVSEQQPYDFRYMYLNAYPNKDNLSSGLSASLIQLSSLTESPLVQHSRPNSFLSNIEDGSVILRETAKKTSKFSPRIIPVSSLIPSASAIEVIPLEVRHVHVVNARSQSESTPWYFSRELEIAF